MENKVEDKDSVIGCFGIIAFVLALALILAVGSLLGETVIRTKDRLEPEWVLQTDGKVVDTLFIYKQK
tara:strand:- start:1608 stop:1811 length:204 start_codon:yes stop_codon:yes gene_type:complete